MSLVDPIRLLFPFMEWTSVNLTGTFNSVFHLKCHCCVSVPSIKGLLLHQKVLFKVPLCIKVSYWCNSWVILDMLPIGNWVNITSHHLFMKIGDVHQVNLWWMQNWVIFMYYASKWHWEVFEIKLWLLQFQHYCL